jgi:hypothetical protein
MTEEQRMEEGRRMFQIFAARMFEQRVLTAYREKVAQERQKKLIEELDEENRLDTQREAKKAKEAAKRKEKKRLQKQAKEEEKAKKDAEKAALEAAQREIEEKKLEEQRQRKEEQRKKREAEKKAAKGPRRARASSRGRAKAARSQGTGEEETRRCAEERARGARGKGTRSKRAETQGRERAQNQGRTSQEGKGSCRKGGEGNKRPCQTRTSYETATNCRSTWATPPLAPFHSSVTALSSRNADYPSESANARSSPASSFSARTAFARLFTKITPDQYRDATLFDITSNSRCTTHPGPDQRASESTGTTTCFASPPAFCTFITTKQPRQIRTSSVCVQWDARIRREWPTNVWSKHDAWDDAAHANVPGSTYGRTASELWPT